MNLVKANDWSRLYSPNQKSLVLPPATLFQWKRGSGNTAVSADPTTAPPLTLRRARRRLAVSPKQIAKDIEREVIDVSEPVDLQLG